MAIMSSSNHLFSYNSIPCITISQVIRPSNPKPYSISSKLPLLHLHKSPTSTSKSNIDIMRMEHAKKLKIFKYVLNVVGREDPFQGLVMIDAIQRLGIDHHFQHEIHEILQGLLLYREATTTDDDPLNNDLYKVSLWFRLLRQEGYYVSTKAFGRFKNNNGMFNKNLKDDIVGLMSLFEASHLGVHGENVLDDARLYSTQLLDEYCVSNPNHGQARIVGYTMSRPHHKNLARFTAKSFLKDSYGTNNAWIDILKGLAKIDYDMARSTYQSEIFQISKWWKELGLAKELSFARDRPLKWYLWSMASLTDSNLSMSQKRIDITKLISFIYLIDDIFDVYGTLEQLELFTQAIVSWDYEKVEQLPHCMKICFKALDNTIDEINYNIYKYHGSSPIESFRKSWGTLANAFLIEARWFGSKNLPKAEEYLKNGVISSGAHIVFVHLFYLLGHEGIAKESVQLIVENQTILSSVATILRLWDDLGRAKDEVQDGHDGSYLQYYMNENQGCSIKDARDHVMSKIDEEWKMLNKELCQSPTQFSSSFIKAFLNLARMVPLMYDYDDNQRLPNLEEIVDSLINMDM